MFTNTRLLSPVVLEGITQAPYGTYEWEAWWKEQRRRCFDGYSAGDITITGPHYWYLNFWKIRAKKEGERTKRLIYPRFTDLDYEFFNVMHDARYVQQKDLLVLKARQKGFSNKYGAIGGHEFSFVPDSQTVVVAGMEKYAKNTFNMIKQGLNELGHTEFYKNKSPNTNSFIKAAYKTTTNGVEQELGFLSTVRYLTSDDDPQVLISLSPSFVIFEEVGAFPGFLETLTYIRPAMESEGVKTGWNLLVGTGGEAGESISDFSKAFYDPEAYDLYAIDRTYDEDIPFDDAPAKTGKKTAVFYGTHRYREIDSDGNSLIQASIDQVNAKRKKVEKNEKVWLTVVTQDPFTPEEALLTPTGNVFNVKKLREQLIYLRKYRDDIMQVGDLEWREPGNPRMGVSWEPNPLGKYRIFEHPKINAATGEPFKRLYLGGTDSYDKDKTASIHGSFGSSHVFKRFLDAEDDGMQYVAHYQDRPETSRDFYDNSAKLMVYYGWCENLIEYSNIGIFHYYEDYGFIPLLKERPAAAYSNTINSQVQNRWGIDPATKDYWILSLQDYVEKYCNKIMDEKLLEALINYKKDSNYNCDTTISASLCQVHEKDMFHTPVKKDLPAKRQMGRFVVVGGKMVKVYS